MLKRPLFAVAAFLAGTVAFEAAQTSNLAYGDASPGVTGGGGSSDPAFSGDGRFLVFLSKAHNLVHEDTPSPNVDVFVQEMGTGRLVLASANVSGTGGANAHALDPSISSNGRLVAFASAASNLVPNDTNRASDIFVRDLAEGTTRLASVDRRGLSPDAASPGSIHPLISGDGRWVFFESTATNLVAAAKGSGALDVFARDLESGQTRLVSVNRQGSGAHLPSESSELCAVTSDGRFAAFISRAPSLALGTPSTRGDLYVRDLRDGVTHWVGTNVAGLLQCATDGYQVLNATIGGDGQSVLFKAVGLGTNAFVFLHHLGTAMTELLATNSLPATIPALSWDGRLAAFEEGPSVLIHDDLVHTNILASVASDGTPLPGSAFGPVLTPDGRNVAFLARTNGTDAHQAFVRDILAGVTRLASVTSAGAPGVLESETLIPSLSADGRFLAFESAGADWVAKDLNRSTDVFVRDLASNATRLVSERRPETPAVAPLEYTPVASNCLSADGGILVWKQLNTTAPWIDTTNHTYRLYSCDIFTRDTRTGNSRLAHHETEGNTGTNDLGMLSISGNGRFVVLQTQWGDASPKGRTILRLDLSNGIAVPASVFAGTVRDSYYSSTPTIDSEGRLIAFQTYERGFVEPSYALGSQRDIILRDMDFGTNSLISGNLKSGGQVTYGNADSVSPLFSPDSRWVVFLSKASNLASNYLSSSQWELYGRDLSSGQTHMLSRSEKAALGCCGLPAFSRDSLRLAFVSSNAVTGSRDVYVCDLATRTNLLVATNATSPTLNSDGHQVAYQTWQPASLGSFTNQVMVRDLDKNTTVPASVNRFGSGGGNGSSSSPLLTPDGRYLVFTSAASDLVDNDANGAADVFLRDLASGQTVALSRSFRNGGTGDRTSGWPSLSLDGSVLAFHSLASDLVPGDYNERRDLFVVLLRGGDSDGDGMDDDWEMAYFGTLDRDGTGDFDADGMSDRDEFVAGTDPTNRGSVLRALVVRSTSGGGAALIWTASPGMTYRVQYKEDLKSAEWSILDQPILIEGSTASTSDPDGSLSSRRFYRVIVAR